MSDTIVKEKKYNTPLFKPYISEKAIVAVDEVLRSKFIGQGPLIPEFEQEFGKKFKSKYNVAVNSCTSALHLAYILAGIKEDDEVLVPLLTCSATIHPLLYLKARPVFVDIKDDFTMDVADIEEKIATSKKLKAIVVMHYGGTMCQMDKIMKLARRYKLKVIEDCAQSLGASYKGKLAGNWGDFGCFSFQAIKYFSTVDGGMLTVKDKASYEKAKRIRWFGIDRDLKIKLGWKQFKNWERREMTYDVTETGYKYHMNNFNAAIGLAHLKETDKILNHYRDNHELYSKLLKNCGSTKVLQKKTGDTIWLETILTDKRDQIAEALNKEGIETNVVHIRSDVYSIFKPFVFGKFPTMDKYELKYLVLPNHMFIGKEEIIKICSIVKSCSI